MKRFLIGFCCGLVFLFLAARGTAYWQDILPKPGVEWVGVCGRGDMSQLAFNINANRAGRLRNTGRITAIEKRLALVEPQKAPDKAPVDANDVEDPNEAT